MEVIVHCLKYIIIISSNKRLVGRVCMSVYLEEMRVKFINVM